MRRALLFVGLGFTVIQACGSSEDGGLSGTGGAAASIPIEDLPAKYAAAACAAYENCLGSYYELTAGPEDCVLVTQRSVEDGGFSLVSDAVDSGKLTYHGDLAQACFDEVATRDCAGLSARSAACDAIFTGTAENGAACELDEECPAGSFCKIGAACPGTCSERATAGADCQKNDHCQTGLVCSKSTSKCVKPAAAGEACEGASYPKCANGLFCAGKDDKAGTPGICKAPDDVFVAAAGATCDLQKTELCQAGLTCMISIDPGPPPTTTQTCVQPLASGADCGIGFPNPCPSGEFCDTGADASKLTGKCAKDVATGQPCRPGVVGSACGAYNICAPGAGPGDATTCQEIQRLGGACSANALCYSGKCSGGACAVPDPCVK